MLHPSPSGDARSGATAAAPSAAEAPRGSRCDGQRDATETSDRPPLRPVHASAVQARAGKSERLARGPSQRSTSHASRPPHAPSSLLRTPSFHSLVPMLSLDCRSTPSAVQRRARFTRSQAHAAPPPTACAKLTSTAVSAPTSSGAAHQPRPLLSTPTSTSQKGDASGEARTGSGGCACTNAAVTAADAARGSSRWRKAAAGRRDALDR